MDQLDISADVTITWRPARDVFGSPFRVTAATEQSAGAFIAAVAHLESLRTRRPVAASFDGLHAAVSFHSERLLSAERLAADLWAPMTGNHRASDGWLRIHANLAPHAMAARRVLGIDGDDVTAAISNWSVDDLVAAIRDAGGVAARMRTTSQWRRHPHHAHLIATPLIARTAEDEGPPGGIAAPLLQGLRVVDCTRVIAGPVAGRLLTSFGATVTRIDAPLDDSRTLELDTGWGKTRTPVDLRTRDGRADFAALLRTADILLEGFRPGALASLGYSDDALREMNPGLVVGHLSAFGCDGPLGGLRGFDSVVQVATGIAHRCGFDDDRGPSQLPAQALDHGAGHLLAAGVVRAIATRRAMGRSSSVTVSLARVGEWLVSLGEGSGRPAADTTEVAGPFLRRLDDLAYGAIEHVSPVGVVAGTSARWPDRALPPR